MNEFTVKMVTGLVVCLLCSTMASADEFRIVRKAYAYSLQDNQLLYTERHQEIWRDGKLNYTQVRYYSPENRLLAEKFIDFAQSATAPEFELNDYRNGYLEGAKKVQKGFELFARRDDQLPLKQKVVQVPEPAVVDGGFDEFIKARWEDLQKGKKIEFNFVTPIEQDYFAFTVKKVAETQFDESAAVVFEMSADSALVRMFVKPIRLTYDRADKSLLQFEGMTNLNNDEGRSYTARLVYPKQDVTKSGQLAQTEQRR